MGKKGQAIATQAHAMGAKTMIHYSFPTHLSKEVIAQRKDAMQKTSNELGMQWVEVVTPDPQTGNGTGPMLQFLREDIPVRLRNMGLIPTYSAAIVLCTMLSLTKPSS